MACRRTAKSPRNAESAVPAVPRLKGGIAMAAMMAMITTTITSSSRLKARLVLLSPRIVLFPRPDPYHLKQAGTTIQVLSSGTP